MNAWNPKETEPGKEFFVTASGARNLKIRIQGGSGTYALESSADGGTTWEPHPTLTAMAINAGSTHAVTKDDYLLNTCCRITGAAGATIYYMQED